MRTSIKISCRIFKNQLQSERTVGNYKIPIVLAPQRGAAYQPRVQPRGKDPRIMIFGQASVIRQYAAFLQNASPDFSLVYRKRLLFMR